MPCVDNDHGASTRANLTPMDPARAMTLWYADILVSETRVRCAISYRFFPLPILAARVYSVPDVDTIFRVYIAHSV